MLELEEKDKKGGINAFKVFVEELREMYNCIAVLSCDNSLQKAMLIYKWFSRKMKTTDLIIMFLFSSVANSPIRGNNIRWEKNLGWIIN